LSRARHTLACAHHGKRVGDKGCARPADQSFVERHAGFSVSYVRKGSFGYRCRGESFELVAGSILVGRPGDECVPHVPSRDGER